MNKPLPVTTSIYSFCHVFINITPNRINTLIDDDCCAVAQTSYFLLKGPRKTWEGPLIAFVFCFFLFSFLNYERIVVVMLVAQLCPTLCNAMDCSLPGSSVHGIFQAKTLEWIAMPSSRNLPNSGIKPASLISPALAGGSFTASVTWEASCSTQASHSSGFFGCGALALGHMTFRICGAQA